ARNERLYDRVCQQYRQADTEHRLIDTSPATSPEQSKAEGQSDPGQTAELTERAEKRIQQGQAVRDDPLKNRGVECGSDASQPAPHAGTLHGGDVDVAREPELFADALFDFLERLGVLAQKRLRVFASLAEP